MNDPIARIPKMLNESNQAHATAYGAMLIALINKGVITREEYDKAYIQAQHTLSQEFARKRDEAQGSVNLGVLFRGDSE